MNTMIQFGLKIAIWILDILLLVVNTICDLIEHLTGYEVFSVRSDVVFSMLTQKHKQHLEEDEIIRRNFDAFLTTSQCSDLSPCGRGFIRQYLFMSLENGCYFKDISDRQNSVKMNRPIILIGMARTGTTLLSNLLVVDPQIYSPTFYQMFPVMYDNVPNIGHLLVSLRSFLGSKHIHDVKKNNEPEELTILFFKFFVSSVIRAGTLGNNYHDRYVNSLDHATWKHIYTQSKIWLEYLAYKNHPGHQKVVIKHHINWMFIRALVEVFPDAVFVNTLRVPEKSIPSNCSLSNAFALASLRNPSAKKERIGKTLIENYAKSTTEYVSFRKEFEGKNTKAVFLDIKYTDLVKDPIKTVSAIYEAANMEFSAAAKSKMETYLKNNKQHKYGVHSYSLQEYGLDQKAVDEAFKVYKDFHQF